MTHGTTKGTASGIPPGPIPIEVRQAARDALIELADRMMRGAQSLLRKSAYVVDPDPTVHRKAASELRRYQGFGMPCSDDVRKIEAAILNMTEAESKKLADEREWARRRTEQRLIEQRREHWEREWEQDGSNRREAVRVALEHAKMLAEAAGYVEQGKGGVELAKALAACNDPRMAECDPYFVLGLKLARLRGDWPPKHLRKSKPNGNVVPGPWEARP